MGDATEIAHHHAKAMVERHGDADARTRLDPSRFANEEGIVDQIVMRQCRALRQTGGTAGELDVHGVIYLDRSRQGFQSLVATLLAPLQDPIDRQAAIVLARNCDDMSQFRQARTVQLAASAPELRDKLAEYPNTARGVYTS